MAVKTYVPTVVQPEHLAPLIKVTGLSYSVALNREGAAEESSSHKKHLCLLLPQWEVNKDSNGFKKLTYIKNILYANILMLQSISIQSSSNINFFKLLNFIIN